jgi:Fur family ferric uptake transcriptional regulator
MPRDSKPSLALSKRKSLPCGRPAVPHGALPTRTQFEKWKTQLRDFLSQQGLKYSEQRWKIAELILSTAGHLDAQSLVARVKQKHPAIGAATVYRNIKVLCDASILKESLTDPAGKIFYELYEEGHHDHIICADCGEIFEFHSDKLENLQSEIVSDLSFQEVRHRHVIYAKCDYRR